MGKSTTTTPSLIKESWGMPGTDMIFLFDSSSGVSPINFAFQIMFAQDLINCVGTYAEPRVSLMTYGDKVNKLFGLNDEINLGMISYEDMVGRDPFTDEALAAVLEELSINGKDDRDVAVALFSYNAPMTNHEACLGDYVSPQLEELREIGVQVLNFGINLDAATVENLQCMVPAGMEDAADDYLVNTDSLDTLAEEMGYTDCAYGEYEDGAQGHGDCDDNDNCYWYYGICECF